MSKEKNIYLHKWATPFTGFDRVIIYNNFIIIIIILDKQYSLYTIQIQKLCYR